MKLSRLLRSISLASLILLLSLNSFSQTFPVQGIITSADGQPLVGVTLQVKGTSTTAVSGADGSFSINAPSANSVLVLTYVGFTSQEVSIGGKSQLTVSMTPLDNSLQDVVVIGYGTARKRDVTGAVAGINQTDIRSRPVDNALQAMQGKV